VDVDERLHDLADIDPRLELSESLPAFGEVLEGVVATVLEEDVDVLLVLEGVNELDDVAVPQRLVDLDLDEKLVALPLLVDALLGDDLRRQQLALRARDRLVALREPARAQQLPLYVGDVLRLVTEDLPVLQLR
jgi:hypothetical protein